MVQRPPRPVQRAIPAGKTALCAHRHLVFSATEAIGVYLTIRALTELAAAFVADSVAVESAGSATPKRREPGWRRSGPEPGGRTSGDAGHTSQLDGGAVPAERTPAASLRP